MQFHSRISDQTHNQYIKQNMKKTIKRGHALTMYEVLYKLSFSYLEDKELEAVMDNLMELEKVQNQFSKLIEELGKRLYGDHDKEQIEAFNAKMTEMQNLKEIEKRIAMLEEIKAEYPELYELLMKQNKVDASLREKDIEIELTEVDRKAFSKAVIKGNPKASYGLFDLFEPMYHTEENEAKETDFSELDELMK